MTKFRVPVLLCALCHTCVANICAQGARLSVETKRLGSGVDTLSVFLVQGTDTVRTGFTIDDWRVDGDRLVRAYSTVDRVLGNGLDTIISSLSDLRPLAYQERSLRRVADLSFAGSQVRGWIKLPNGDSTVVAARLPSVVYDDAAFDLVVRASPLRDGFRVVVPSYVIGANAVSNFTASVAGRESIDGHECWVVKATVTGMPVSFWIDAESRRLRRQVMEPRAGFFIILAHAAGQQRRSRAT